MTNYSDFYDILGISPEATQEEIKRAFRKKAHQYHPDHGGSDEIMHNLIYAYEQLSNPNLKASYDSTRKHYSKQNSKKNSYNKGEEGKNTKNQKEKKANYNYENYEKATFVDGIEAIDKTGNTNYIKVGDYVYFPVDFSNKFLIFSFKDKEYYRGKIKKIYSQKLNNFVTVPLFILEIESFEQIVFVKDFSNYWMSEPNYNKNEIKKALKTLFYWVAFITFIAIIFS